MNQQIKTRWVNALKSGEYEQCTRFLARDGKFCCLGVLTDLYLKETNQDWVPTECIDDKILMYDNARTILPFKVAKWAELRTCNPDISARSFGSEDYVESLAALNDAGASFGAIAEVIENEL